MSKYCPGCDQTKALSDFAKNASKKDGLQGQCRACKKRMDAGHYVQNKEAQLARNRKNTAKYRKEIGDYKAQRGCLLCPENDPCCLDFHHLKNKKKAVATMASAGLGKQLWDEVEKCVILCACCHRKIHAGRKEQVDRFNALVAQRLRAAGS